MTTVPLFMVRRSHGPQWNPTAPLEEQIRWHDHAEFMDRLYEEGFALLVGPLEGSDDAMLIVRARDEGEIEDRLRDDPWTGPMLNTTEIRRWTLRLGSLA